MLEDIKEELYPKFVQFFVFSTLGAIAYYLMVFVVSTATTFIDLTIGANFVGISAALLVSAMMIAGSMPTDD